MFLKIKDEEILNINQIKRIKKEQEIIYEETDEYKKYLSENKGIFCFFSGNRYTDKIINTLYKIIVFTCDFEELEFIYDNEEEWREELEYIWNSINLDKED